MPCCGGCSRGCGGRLHAGGCASGRRRGRRARHVLCSAFPAAVFRFALLRAERCNSGSPVPRGRTGLGGGRAASARPERGGAAGRGAGAGWSSRRGCPAAPAVSAQPLAERWGGRSPARPAPLAPPGRPQGPGTAAAGTRLGFPPVFPRHRTPGYAE